MYNSYDGIKTAIQTLDGFNALVKQRQEAYYQRKEILKEFVVLGRWFLDSCGNCMKAVGISPIDIWPNMDNVEHWFWPKHDCEHFTFGIPSNVPPSHVICPECKKHWSIDDCHDVVVKSETKNVSLKEFVGWNLGSVYYLPENEKFLKTNDECVCLKNWEDYIIQERDEVWFWVWTYYHSSCNKIVKERNELKYFQEIFAAAGFNKTEFTPIPNQYCPCEHCAPWFDVKTELGVIRIGWRKRVINIECNWNDLKQLFPNEDVTKEKNYIHAWGKEKAIEYLTKIKCSPPKAS